MGPKHESLRGILSPGQRAGVRGKATHDFNITPQGTIKPLTRWLAIAAAFLALAVSASTLPPNLALSARATATSEYSADHRAQFAVDGKIQGAGLRDDAGKAWCVRGDTHRNGADLTFEWTNAVTVAEVVYYGRTAWFAEECWKDREVLAEGTPTPVARSTFRMGHGPQRLRLEQRVVTRQLTLHFTSSMAD